MNHRETAGQLPGRQAQFPGHRRTPPPDRAFGPVETIWHAPADPEACDGDYDAHRILCDDGPGMGVPGGIRDVPRDLTGRPSERWGPPACPPPRPAVRSRSRHDVPPTRPHRRPRHGRSAPGRAGHRVSLRRADLGVGRPQAQQRRPAQLPQRPGAAGVRTPCGVPPTTGPRTSPTASCPTSPTSATAATPPAPSRPTSAPCGRCTPSRASRCRTGVSCASPVCRPSISTVERNVRPVLTSYFFQDRVRGRPCGTGEGLASQLPPG